MKKQLLMVGMLLSVGTCLQAIGSGTEAMPNQVEGKAVGVPFSEGLQLQAGWKNNTCTLTHPSQLSSMFKTRTLKVGDTLVLVNKTNNSGNVGKGSAFDVPSKKFFDHIQTKTLIGSEQSSGYEPYSLSNTYKVKSAGNVELRGEEYWYETQRGQTTPYTINVIIAE